MSGRIPFAEFVTEGSRVVAAIRSQRQQVAGVSPGDLWTNPMIGFLAGRGVDVGDVQRFDVDEGGDFQCANAVVSAFGGVTTGLITVETRRVNGGVASTFLDWGVEKRTPELQWKSFKTRSGTPCNVGAA